MATNKIPEVLNDFRAYDENQTNMLGIASVEYPGISNLTQTVKGTGVGGEIEAPVGRTARSAGISRCSTELG